MIFYNFKGAVLEKTLVVLLKKFCILPQYNNALAWGGNEASPTASLGREPWEHAFSCKKYRKAKDPPMVVTAPAEGPSGGPPHSFAGWGVEFM